MVSSEAHLWSSGKVHAAKQTARPSRWEQLCTQLGIDPEDTKAHASSRELREFAKQNYTHRYVPTSTLLAFGLSTYVDENEAA